MSHTPQRKEKDCLNCGAIVQGRFCHNCGQENTEPHETFWHMVTHFFYDITHFDGSFFTTLKDLLFKPGFLSKEYMRGRRKAYLHPVRMYVFTSAVFFLVFFSLFSIKESDIEVTTEKPDIADISKPGNSTTKKDTSALLYKAGKPILVDNSVKSRTDSLGKVIGRVGSNPVRINFGGAEKYNSLKEYDSIQSVLPANKRDGWFVKLLYRKVVSINEKYKGKESKLMTDILNEFIHSFPYLLFVSLPLYAFFLKLLYIRKKQFYFADHAVFLIHLYIFTFLFMLIFFGTDKLEDNVEWGGFGIVKTILITTGLVYTLRAMRSYYGQRWGKTIFKFILFNLLCLITAGFLFGIFFLLSFYQL